LCGRDAVQIQPPKPTEIDLVVLKEKLKNLGDVKQNEYLLRLTIDDFELTVFRDARAIVRGTDDVTTARSLYARYIGS
jgi:adenylyltransferase/sulfurtransferase